MKDWLESVYSDTTEYFVSNPYPKKGEEVTFYLRMVKNSDVRHVFLLAREYGIEGLHEMQVEYEKNGLLYYAAKVRISDPIFCYQFYLATESEIFYYTQFRITDYIPGEDADFILLADYDAPRWVQDTVFYQIFPDRFCNGNPELDVKEGEYSYQGYKTRPVSDWNEAAKEYEEGRNLDFHNGDLYGIIEKLDYLQELGINGIYLNPIFVSPSIHKYDALDYFHIDSHLGGDEALAKLIDAMHKRGMKLLLDISVNHTSSSSKWFNKGAEFYPATEGAYNDENSPYRPFYFFNKDGSYRSWFNVQTMPQLNYTSPELRDVIYRKKDSVLKKWLLPPYGIDGWRFDVADCLARNEEADVHGEVLEEIRMEIKSVKPDAYLVAEEWADCAVDLQGNRWDATMNYFGCARPIREFVGAKDLYNERNETLRKVKSRLTAPQLAHRITQFYARLPGAIQRQQFNLLDSHDVVRLHNIKGVSPEDYKTALVMLFTLPGTPSVYYGDEIFLDGSERSVDACRYPFNWDWQESKEAVSCRDLYKTLISFRRLSLPLKSGGFKVISAEGYVFCYARFTREYVVFIACSTADEEQSVKIPLSYFGLSSQNEYKELFARKVEKTLCDGGRSFLLKIPPHSSLVLSTAMK